MTPWRSIMTLCPEWGKASMPFWPAQATWITEFRWASIWPFYRDATTQFSPTVRIHSGLDFCQEDPKYCLFICCQPIWNGMAINQPHFKTDFTYQMLALLNKAFFSPPKLSFSWPFRFARFPLAFIKRAVKSSLQKKIDYLTNCHTHFLFCT